MRRGASGEGRNKQLGCYELSGCFAARTADRASSGGLTEREEGEPFISQPSRPVHPKSETGRIVRVSKSRQTHVLLPSDVCLHLYHAS
jgi:hypothetical protein